MNDRTIWIVRLIAVFIFLLLAYLMISLYAKLQRMRAEEGRRRAALELQIPGLPHAPRSGDIV